MTGSDHTAAPGSDRRRGGRGIGGLLLGAVLVLAVLGAAALVFSDDERLLRLGILAALWAALVGAFAAARYRRESTADHDRGEELRRVYELELEREVAARREYELEVEADTRRRLEEEVRDEVRVELDGVRSELRTLRQNLEALLGGEVLVERVALRAESTRLRSLSDQSRAVRSALPRGSSADQWAGEIVTGHLDSRSAFDGGAFDGSRTGHQQGFATPRPVFDAATTGQWPRDPASASRNGNGAHPRNGDPTRTAQQRAVDPRTPDPRTADPTRTGPHRTGDPSRTGPHRPGDLTRTGPHQMGDQTRTAQQRPVDPRAGDPSRTGAQRGVTPGAPPRPVDLSSTGQWPRDPAGPAQPGRRPTDQPGGVRGMPSNGGQTRPGPPDPTDILPRYQGTGAGSPDSNPFGTWAPRPTGNGSRPDATGSHNRADIASQTGGHNRGDIAARTGGYSRAEIDAQAGGHRRAETTSTGSHVRAEIRTATGGHSRAEVAASTGGHRRAEVDQAAGGRRRADEGAGGRRRADDSGGGRRRAAEQEGTSGRRRRGDEDSGSHAAGHPSGGQQAPVNDEPRSGRRRRRDDG